jgi:hypothetical protein
MARPVNARERAALKSRSDGICEICGVAAATNFHHRKNRSQLGGNNIANALHLCGSGTTGCHGMVTEHPRDAYTYGWSVRSGFNPADVKVLRRGTWVLLDDEGLMH